MSISNSGNTLSNSCSSGEWPGALQAPMPLPLPPLHQRSLKPPPHPTRNYKTLLLPQTTNQIHWYVSQRFLKLINVATVIIHNGCFLARMEERSLKRKGKAWQVRVQVSLPNWLMTILVSLLSVIFPVFVELIGELLSSSKSSQSTPTSSHSLGSSNKGDSLHSS